MAQRGKPIRVPSSSFSQETDFPKPRINGLYPPPYRRERGGGGTTFPPKKGEGGEVRGVRGPVYGRRAGKTPLSRREARETGLAFPESPPHYGNAMPLGTGESQRPRLVFSTWRTR